MRRDWGKPEWDYEHPDPICQELDYINVKKEAVNESHNETTLRTKLGRNPGQAFEMSWGWDDPPMFGSQEAREEWAKANPEKAAQYHREMRELEDEEPDSSD